MSMLLNVGAAVTNTFGPLILKGLGYDKYKTSLLSMPFGALQFLVIILASYLAQRARVKGAVLAVFMLPVVAGLAMLYVLPRSKTGTSPDQGALLAGYYLLAFLFGGNPLIVTWIVGNTAGTTKKSVVMSLYNAASSAGNIVGPLLFNKKDSPAYKPGLRACLGIFVGLVCVVLIQWGNLVFLNKLQERRRIKSGKVGRLVDHSMADKYHGMEDETDDESVVGGAGVGSVEGVKDEDGLGTGTEGREVRRRQERDEKAVGRNAFMDLTDRENDEFVYIY